MAGGAATLGFPFTAAQWKELERQAMIYKYMVASLPIPYQLLLPIPPPPHSHSHPLVRYSSTKQDLEPGRCKRTDGKKWRCSRDVAPNHKYCDRHMHRGRPRSRKHVELPKLVGSTILPSSSTPTPTPLFLNNNNNNNNNMQSNKRGSDWRQQSILNKEFGEELQSLTENPPFIHKSKVIKDSSALDLSMAMGNGFSCGGPLAEVLPPSLVLTAVSSDPYPTAGDPSHVQSHRTTMLPVSTPTDQDQIVAFQCFT